MNENILFKINFYFLLLIPLAILSGPAIPDILVSSSGILFIILSLKYRLFNYYKSFFFIIFLIFYFLIILSSFLSSDILFSLESSLFYFRFGIFALNIWFVIENTNKKFLFLFTISITLSIIIAFTSGYIQYLSLIQDFNINSFRVSGIFDDELVLGSFISRIMPISIGLIFLSFFKKNKTKIFYYLISIYFFLSVLITIISGERAAIINIILLSILLIIFIDLKLKFKFIILFSIVTTFVTIVFLDDRIYNRLILKTYNDLIIEENQSNEKLEIYYVSKEHHYGALTAINMFKKNIFIGIGPKMFRKECLNKEYLENIDYGGSCFMHPHNSYLQLLAEVGIVPTMILFSLFFFIIYKMIKTYSFKKNYFNKNIINLEFYLYVTLFITLWPINQNGNFFNNWLNVIYYLPVGIILSLNSIKESYGEKKKI